MAAVGNYKEYQRTQRMMVVEDLFNLGMSYVDTPLNEGLAKLLVNFDLKSQGSSLTPRGGWKLAEINANLSDLSIQNDGQDYYAVHHVGMALVENAYGTDATMHKYVLVAKITHDQDNKLVYCLNPMHVFLETADGFVKASHTRADVYTDPLERVVSMHGMDLEEVPWCSQGRYVSIEGNTYIPVFDTYDNKRKFVRLHLGFATGGEFYVTLDDIVPKEIPASQVINTGYNMLKADPYDFPNTANSTGGLVLGGIIPKDASGTIKLTADVGETITYHLNYTYPTADAVDKKKYMAQWEINDTTTGATTQVIQQVRKSPQYTPGDAITLTHTIPYKQYTTVVKVYDAAVVAAHTYVSDEDDAKSLEPIKVITVSSYYTAAGTARNAANLTPRKYDLTTCTGLCTWQQRLVLWGVKNATTTLFVSQPNLPEYMPYPNNVEVFPEDIIRCVPYLTYMLVFTRTKLFQLTLVDDGIRVYYTTKCIQERLSISKEDASTIQVVKNMVYFKSDNYFFMIVPNSRVGVGELQIAPVSRPIEQLLDNFEEAAKKIIDNIYNISYMFDLKEGSDDSHEIKFIDYTNYLDGSTMRNIYKCRVKIYKAATLMDTRYVDFVLNYDTQLRAWTIYTYETSPHRLTPYESTVTSGMTVLAPIQFSGQPEGLGMTLQLIKMDVNTPVDDFTLETVYKERKFTNYQLIDTGYRAHMPTYQKRFREIQFSINNIRQDTLQFYTSFTVDDIERRDIFKHTVQQITDPTSPDYGLIYVERTLDESLDVPGAIRLEDGWILDFSKFPDITVAKVKYKVSGKGYLGKITILSKNTNMYELLGTSWVYRKMNGR